MLRSHYVNFPHSFGKILLIKNFKHHEKIYERYIVDTFFYFYDSEKNNKRKKLFEILINLQ